MIKAIIFDCFGVLSNTNLWHEFLATLDDELQVEEAKELNRQCDAGVISRDDFFEKIHQTTGKKLHDVESLSSTQGLKNVPLIGYIETLKKRGFKLAILSNIGSNWITDEFLNEQEQALFDEMVFSFEVGTIKPDPSIYKIACEKLNVEPREAIFVDDIEDYCKAAEALGITGIHYKNFQQLKGDLEQALTQQS